MMVLGTPPDSNADSQTRQLRVNKKLSKAISAVPRSRFQKPRPNLPGCKRGDLNVSASIRKTITTTQNNQKSDTISSTHDEISQKVDAKNSSLLTTEEKFEKGDVSISEELPINDTTYKKDNISSEASYKRDDGGKKHSPKKEDVKNETSQDDNNFLEEKVIKKDTGIHVEVDTPTCSLYDQCNNSSNGNVSRERSSVFQKKDDKSCESSEEKNDINMTVLSTKKKLSKAISSVQRSRFQKPRPNVSVSKRSDSTSSSVQKTVDTILKTDEGDNATLNTGEVSKIQDESKTAASSESEKTLQKKAVDDIPEVCLEEPFQSGSNEDVAPLKPNNIAQKENIQTTPTDAESSASTTEKSSKYPHLTTLLSKKRTEAKREVQRKKQKKYKKGCVAPDRNTMTMADLIYWNPTNADESQKNVEAVDEILNSNNHVEEERVDDVEESNMQDSVPKLVISEDGQINIDQSSLFISRNVPEPTTTEVIRKDDTTYSSFRKRPLTKHWDAKDTTKFYKALSLVGADFSLMEQIFPNRARRELKQKFKREEKFNIDLINKVLYESHTFDENKLNDFITECEADDLNSTNGEDTAKGKKTARKRKITKKTDSVDAETCDSVIDEADTVLSRKEESNKKRKRKKTAAKSDDDEVLYLPEEISCHDTSKKEEVKKRKRNAKKLPDGFVSIDCITEFVDLDDEETNDSFVESNSSRNTERNLNDSDDQAPPETSSNRSCEVMNIEAIPGVNKLLESEPLIGSKNINTRLNHKKPIQKTVPLVNNEDKEYVSVEYIPNVDSETDLAVGNVMAFEVVTSESPVKRGRKATDNKYISPKKSQQTCLPLILSSTNYTPA